MRKRFQAIILSLRGKWSEYGQIRGHTEGIYKAAGKEYRQYERHMQSAHAFLLCVIYLHPEQVSVGAGTN